MARARIRSLKPECWQDEAVGQVTRDARLLFVGLITQADDAGRMKGALPLLRSQIYPYDFELPLETIETWLRELEGVGLAVRYAKDERSYVALPGWEKNQKVDHAKDSELPPPPKKGSARSGAKSREDSRKNARTSPPRARPRIGSDLDRDQGSGNVAPNGATDARAAEKEIPEDLPAQLHPFVEPVHQVLTRIASAKQGAQAPTMPAVANTLRRFPRKNFVTLAEDYAHWSLHGNGAGKSVKDVVRAYRNWIEKEPDVLRPDPPSGTAPTDRTEARLAEAQQ